MIDLPKIALVAAVVAFLSAMGIAVGALNGTVVVLPFALIPLFAGIQILRRRAWGAYGYLLCLTAQFLLLILLHLLRSANPATEARQFAGLAVIAFLLALLFLMAGRSLTQSGAQRGSPVPWIVIALITTVPLIFLQPFVIPTGAMEDTILVGDRILVPVFPHAKPMRGDMVVFVYPIDRRQTFVKRIIGVPGDRLHILHKVVYLNGAPLAEPWAMHKTGQEDFYRDNFPNMPSPLTYPQAQEMLAKDVQRGEIIVPAGKYFVLGDNRDLSLDSRYWGFITDADIIGKPLLIYDSAEENTAQLAQPDNVFRPRHTRWNRLFKLL